MSSFRSLHIVLKIVLIGLSHISMDPLAWMHGKMAWQRPLDALKLPFHTRGLIQDILFFRLQSSHCEVLGATIKGNKVRR